MGKLQRCVVLPVFMLSFTYGGTLYLHKIMSTPTYGLELWVFCDKMFGVIFLFLFFNHIFLYDFG